MSKHKKKYKTKIRKKRKPTLTRHHINPSSKGGDNGEKNIAYIDIIRHQKYHSLFENKTPTEIITYLLDDFWNEQTEWIEEALKRYKPKSGRKNDNHFDGDYDFFEDIEEEDWYQGA